MTDEVEKPAISPAQVRAGRALLGITADQLAKQATIGVATVRRFETGGEITVANRIALQRALEESGIRFLNELKLADGAAISEGVGLSRKRSR